jgi:4-hydroxy-4-methyl-2-oxoglutarate aldolase
MIDPAIRPAWPGAQICGLAETVECPPGDNLMLHVAVANVSPGVVLVATVGGFLSAGAWGEILTAAAQARGIAGLVIDGAARDIDAIRQVRFPVFSRGLAIGACTKERPGNIGHAIQFGGTTVRPGDLVLGDADGLVVVAQERLDEVYETACRRRQREREIIGKLRQGRTTMELLGLVDPRGTSRRD